MRKRTWNRVAGLAAAAAVSAWGGNARALPIELEDGWEANWNTTLSVGSTWRADDRSPKLYKGVDGARIGVTGGTGGSNSDANTLNYDQGDRVSTIFKIISDLEVKRDQMGGVVRVKAWFDQALAKERVAYGNQANGYAANQALSDQGLQPLQRFDGVQLLDAYVYNTFDVADRPLQVRLGRQVINWGESMFFQGVNQISPLDVPALRRPGAELKEGLLPVWAGNVNIGLGGGASVEGFYQMLWEETTADACGTYWSTVDIAVGINPAKCDKIVVGTPSSTSGIATGNYAPLLRGKRPDDSGQFGLSFKVPVDLIDTEFGFYGMNIHSRNPVISGRTGSWGRTPAALRSTLNPMVAHQNNAALRRFGITTATGYWEYPENVQVYGVSATTNLAGWSVGSEVNYTPNLPVQRNPNDIINALLTGRGPMSQIVRQSAALTEIDGYDRLQKTQFQLNGVKSFGGILGADKSTLMGEVAFQWNNAPNYKSGSNIRYGRSFIFGTGSSSSENTCTNGANDQSDGCRNDGYVTPFAWGYRLRGQLEFPQIFNTAITFLPSLFIAHDVSGISADGQMIEDRFQTGIGLRFSYERQYNLDINYMSYADWATYDPLRDHDFVSASISATF